MRSDSGAIERDGLYTLAQFQRLTGLKEWALRAARRAGLKVVYLHGRGFVRGADWHAYVDGVATSSASPTK